MATTSTTTNTLPLTRLYSIPNSQNPPALHSLSFFPSPSSFLGCSITLSHQHKCHPLTASATLTLPTANPDRLTGEKVPQWSERAIKSFTLSTVEARKFRMDNTGTEAFLAAILLEGTTLAAKFLWTNGITLTKVREEIKNLFGYRYDHLLFQNAQTPPLTESAQKVLDWAVDQKLESGDDGEITTVDLLLSIWYDEESHGHEVLVALGFDNEKAETLKSLSSKPGFDEG